MPKKTLSTCWLNMSQDAMTYFAFTESAIINMSDGKTPSTPVSALNPEQACSVDPLQLFLPFFVCSFGMCMWCQSISFSTFLLCVCLLIPIAMQMDKMVKRQAVTPGGLLMDIVLTPALKPGPRLVWTCHSLQLRPIFQVCVTAVQSCSTPWWTAFCSWSSPRCYWWLEGGHFGIPVPSICIIL